MALSSNLERLSAPWERLTHENPPVAALDALLRGCGQVMFQNNPLTGLLFLAGIFVNSTLLGLAGLLGLIVSTLTAWMLRVNHSLLRAGLFGYNGILVGIGLAFFLQWNAFVILYIILGAAVSSIVMMGFINLFGRADMPALTAPFVLTTWLFLFAVFLFSHLPPSQSIQPALLNPSVVVQTELRPLPAGSSGAGLTLLNLLEAMFRGIGEVFFQDSLITGVIFLLAILINSRISALFALLGSIAGLITALFLFGGNGYWAYHGLYGFNAVLSAIAIGGVFYVLTWESALYALFCALVSTILMASISVLLSPLGMPALTAPFVITAWLFIAPRTTFHALHSVALADVSKPEVIRQQYLARLHSNDEGSFTQPAP